MGDRQLRSDLIRLAASSTPEVRKALLPLLSKGASGTPKTAGKVPPPIFKQALKALKAAAEAMAEFEALTTDDVDVGPDERVFTHMYETNVELDGLTEYFEDTYTAG